MAKFSQAFLQGMLQPSYQKGLFTAAQQAGQLPTQMRQMREEEAKKQQALQRYDQAVQTSEQGIAAAQQGDVSALTNRIAELRKQMASATTLQEKQQIRAEMANLQRLQPGAQKIAVGNKAQSIVQGEEALKDESLSGPARLAIEQRLEFLKQDPEAMSQYNKFKMDQWRTDQAQKEIQSQQWLATNSEAINRAITNNDMDAVESIVEGAGEFSEAAQSFVATSLRNADAMARLEENSMERKIAPSVDYYQEQLDALPAEIRKTFKGTFDAYKDAADKGWNGSEWSTGERMRAKQLEKTLQGQLRAVYSQIATSEYFAKQKEGVAKREQIAQLELQIATPMSSEYVRQGRIQAASLLKKDEELTQAMIDQEARSLYQMDQRRAISQLAALRGESPEEMPIENAESVITQAMSANPGKTRDQVVSRLKAKGLIPGDYVEEKEIKTQEEMITEPGLINPFRARMKLEQNPYQGLSDG